MIGIEVLGDGFVYVLIVVIDYVDISVCVLIECVLLGVL